jgi:tetratricopeptide (TPR) repeat protein
MTNLAKTWFSIAVVTTLVTMATVVNAESAPDIATSTNTEDPMVEQIDRYMLRAANDYSEGKTLSAIADYTAVIRLDPNLAIAYNNRAIAKMKVRDYRGAFLDYTQVLRIEPEKAIVYNNRAVVRQQMGDCRGAAADLAVAARLFKQQGNLRDYDRTIANLSRFKALLK